jgi:predicted DCC family thiol-disulfide oxidoreductase YuxK
MEAIDEKWYSLQKMRYFKKKRTEKNIYEIRAKHRYMQNNKKRREKYASCENYSTEDIMFNTSLNKELDEKNGL